MLRFEVRDTGVGVPPAKRQEIFQEFVQADSSHARKFGGTGLGLAISKRLVDTMGGEIGVDAAPDGGSCFWFTLPAKVVAPAQASKPLAGMRVAVMSKNKALREGLYLQIAAAGGIPADPSGATDAVLIDAGTANVPELTVQPDPAIPALVLLTPNARGALEEMRAMGFAGYLVKPVRQSSLVTRLILCRGLAGTGGAGRPREAPAGETACTPQRSNREARKRTPAIARRSRPRAIRRTARLPAPGTESHGHNRFAYSPGRGQSHQHDADPRVAAPARP